jgi:hypothetical protein
MQTERVTYLTSAEHKAALEAFAKSRGKSVGNVVREATAKFIGQPTDDEEAELSALLEQVNAAVPRMQQSLTLMSEEIQRLHAENDVFFREKGIR